MNAVASALRYHLLRLRRRHLQVGAVDGTTRQATGAKARIGVVWLVFIGALNLIQVAFLETALVSLALVCFGQTAVPGSVTLDGTPEYIPVPALPGLSISAHELSALTVMVVAVLAIAFFADLVRTNTSELDSDLAWFWQFPIPVARLFLMQVCERAVPGMASIVFPVPMLFIIFHRCSPHAFVLLLVPLILILLLLVSATAQTLYHFLARRLLSRATMKVLRQLLYIPNAIIGICLVSLFVLMQHDANSPLVQALAGLPEWFRWTPAGLAVQCLAAEAPGGALWLFGLLTVECVAIAVLGSFLFANLLSAGLVTRIEIPSGRTRERRGRVRDRLLWTPFQAKLLRYVLPESSALMRQLILAAIMMVALAQFPTVRGQLVALAQATILMPNRVGALALGVLTLLFGNQIIEAITGEGPSIWFMYCVPKDIGMLVVEAATFWSSLLVFLVVALFALAVACGMHLGLRAAATCLLSCVYAMLFCHLAVCLGLLDADPFANRTNQRVNPAHRTLALMVQTTQILAILSEQPWDQLTALVLSVLATLAMWQKAKDGLPYLLDPVEAAPRRVSLSDGLFALQAFLCIRLYLLAFSGPAGLDSGIGTGTVLFVAAGTAVAVATRLIYWTQGFTQVPVVVGPNLVTSVATAVRWGGIAATIGLAYLYLGPRLPYIPTPWLTIGGAEESTRYQVLLLLVILAPLFEEFLFRGLVFGGFRRSCSLAQAAWLSAIVFVIYHPPGSAIPLTILGLCTARAYEETGTLAAPIMAHAFYNAAVYGVQLLAY